MLLAPRGLPGRAVLTSFRAMALGRNPGKTHDKTFDHPDGWGIVYEEDGRLKSHRSARPCWDDPDFDGFGAERVFLLHARRGTSGEVSADNAHPFSLYVDGATWFFCHNGTVRDLLPDPGERVGEASTDSCRLFRRLAAEGLGADPAGAIRSAYARLADFTSLNTLLLSDREAWAVCCWTRDGDYYTLHLGEAASGPIVSSEPLDGIGRTWVSLANGDGVRVDRRTGALERRALLTASRRKGPLPTPGSTP
mgnify:CR=1 FL=1